MKIVDRCSRRVAILASIGALAFGTAVAQAQTFKFANQGDALSMDPHSLNESLQLSFTGNIYEPLIARGKKLELVPALATDWKQTAPTVWRFNLRKNVKFHDGTPFTADDVIFSYTAARAAAPTSRPMSARSRKSKGRRPHDRRRDE